MLEFVDVDYGPWALASLRIASDTMTTEEISELLDLEPTHARMAEGEPEFTVWMHQGGLSPAESAEDHLMILLERLSDRIDRLQQLATTAAVEIWVSFSPGSKQRSVVLDAATLQMIASYELDLVIDTYPASKR